MEKLVFLRFRLGDFQQGFEVLLRIGADAEIEGNFPAAPNIPELYQRWRKDYLALGLLPRGRIGQGQAMNSTDLKKQCRRSAKEFRDSIRAWLNAENRELQRFREKLLQGLRDSLEEIRVIIQAEDPFLRQLPWQEWDLFSDIYINAEIALSPLEYGRAAIIAVPAVHKKQVSILAILGNSEGINVESDRQFIESLPGANTVFLAEPRRRDVSDRLWEQDWDILFFAGHSSSQGETGRMSINQTESLTVGDLKRGLRKAIQRGLRIAIFNSCDGLGLARELEDLHIPQIIVMREPVPDNFAQEFLKHFLTAFAGDKSLYLAVRNARERLYDQGLDDEFPGATWLPVICQNPAEGSPTWQELALGKFQEDKGNGNYQAITALEYLMPRFRSAGGLDFITANHQSSSAPQVQLLTTICDQLEAVGRKGLITEIQYEPSDSHNKLKLLAVLEKQISEDEEFANKLMVLFKQVEATGIIPSVRPGEVIIHQDQRSGGVYFEGKESVKIQGDVVGGNQTKNIK